LSALLSWSTAFLPPTRSCSQRSSNNKMMTVITWPPDISNRKYFFCLPSGWPDEFVKIIAQNEAHANFCQNSNIVYTSEKCSSKLWATFVIFKKTTQSQSHVGREFTQSGHPAFRQCLLRLRPKGVNPLKKICHGRLMNSWMEHELFFGATFSRCTNSFFIGLYSTQKFKKYF
jgi:hypothetical protein